MVQKTSLAAVRAANSNLPKLKLNIEDIMHSTGECRAVVFDAIDAGHLRTFLVGRRRFARPADVEKWVTFLQHQSDKGKPVQYRNQTAKTQEAAA